MRERYTLDDINAAFDNGEVDCRKILNSDDPLEAFYDEAESDEVYEFGSGVAREYVPETDELL